MRSCLLTFGPLGMKDSRQEILLRIYSAEKLPHLEMHPGGPGSTFEQCPWVLTGSVPFGMWKECSHRIATSSSVNCVSRSRGSSQLYLARPAIIAKGQLTKMTAIGTHHRLAEDPEDAALVQDLSKLDRLLDLIRVMLPSILEG